MANGVLSLETPINEHLLIPSYSPEHGGDNTWWYFLFPVGVAMTMNEHCDVSVLRE